MIKPRLAASDKSGVTSDSTKRALGWALVAALTVAAITASAALLEGDIDETEWRVLGMSLGFAFFSGTAAAGSIARLRASKRLQDLGLLTIVSSAAAFVLLGAVLWIDTDADALLRGWGCTGLVAIASSHACLVAGARRSTDSAAIEAIASTSIATSVVDAFLLGLGVAGAVEEIDDGMAQFMGVLVIVLLLTTALPPIMRRLQPAPARAEAPPQRREPAVDAGGEPVLPTTERASAGFAAEVMAAADRIEDLNRDPGNRAPEIRRECDRLRRLARGYAR
jgi:hypothetical protein